MFDIRDHGGSFGGKGSKYRLGANLPVTAIKPYTSIPFTRTIYPQSFSNTSGFLAKCPITGYFFHFGIYSSTLFTVTKISKDFSSVVRSFYVTGNTNGVYPSRTPIFAMEKDGVLYFNIDEYSTGNYRSFRLRSVVIPNTNAVTAATDITISGRVSKVLKVTDDGIYAEREDSNNTPSNNWSISFFSFTAKSWTKILDLTQFYQSMGSYIIQIEDMDRVFLWRYGASYYIELSLEGIILSTDVIPMSVELYNIFYSQESADKKQMAYSKKLNKIIGMYNSRATDGGVWYKVLNGTTLATEASFRIKKSTSWNDGYACTLNNNTDMLAILCYGETSSLDDYMTCVIAFTDIDARGCPPNYDITNDDQTGPMNLTSQFWSGMPVSRSLGTAVRPYWNIMNDIVSMTGSVSNMYTMVTSASYTIVK